MAGQNHLGQNNEQQQLDELETPVVTNGNITSGGTVTAQDLVVLGTTTQLESEVLVIEDSLIKLGLNNQQNLQDGGIIIEQDVSTSAIYSGIIKDKSDNDIFKVVQGLTTEPVSTNNNTAIYDANLAEVKASNFRTNLNDLNTMSSVIDTNSTNNSGPVTVHSDVTSAGSGAIITTQERQDLTDIINNQFFNYHKLAPNADNTVDYGHLFTRYNFNAIAAQNVPTQNGLVYNKTNDRWYLTSDLNFASLVPTVDNTVVYEAGRENLSVLDVATNSITSNTMTLNGAQPTALNLANGGLQVAKKIRVLDTTATSIETDGGIQAAGAVIGSNLYTDAKSNLNFGSNIITFQNNSDCNIIVGVQNMDGAPTNFSGSRNIVLGCESLANLLDTNEENIAIGADVGQQVQTNNNILIGAYSGQNMQTGGNNIAIGRNSLSSNNNNNDRGLGNSNNVCIGHQTMWGKQNTDNSSNNNVCIGRTNMRDAINCTQNISVGISGFLDAENYSGCIGIGNFHGQGWNATVQDAVLIGRQAGRLWAGAQDFLFLLENNGNKLLHGYFNTNELSLYGALNKPHVVTPSNPAAGNNKLYFKSDNNLYHLSSGGNEEKLSNTSELGGYISKTDTNLQTIAGPLTTQGIVNTNDNIIHNKKVQLSGSTNTDGMFLGIDNAIDNGFSPVAADVYVPLVVTQDDVNNQGIILRRTTNSGTHTMKGISFISKNGQNAYYRDSGANIDCIFTGGYGNYVTTQLQFSTSSSSSGFQSGSMLLDDSGRLSLSGNRLRISNPSTVANSTDGGTQGDIKWDANHIYVCVANNTWKRTALSTW